MPLVNLPALEDCTPVLRAALAEAGKLYDGQILNNWSALANSEGLFPAYFPFLRAVAGPGQLDQRIKELVALHTVMLNRCRYSVSHRLRSCAKAGIADNEIAALTIRDITAFDSREQLALRLAERITLDVPTQSARSGALLDDEDTAKLKKHFTDAELVELTLGISLWNGLARFHRVLDLPLDMPAPPPAIEAVL